MNNYYHCYNCNNIPNIIISDEQVKINCSGHHEIITNINDFCKNCIKKCKCENCIYYENRKYKYCTICSEKIKINKPIQFSLNNSNPEIINCNETLNKFINEINSKIDETLIILNKMKNELFLYKCLMTKERKFINREAISNLQNLKIFNKIEEKKLFFIKKMNEINNELKNFHNFEYKKENNGFTNYNKDNNLFQINDNIENKSRYIIFKNYGIDENNFYKYFKNPEKPLYQIHAIKLEDIENRNSYITLKLVNISDRLEEININYRNKFLENVKYIGEKSNKLSMELFKLLKIWFKKNYPGIILDLNKEEKRALSSWFNQSLIINASNKDDLFKRPFFEYMCKQKINEVKNYIQIDSKFRDIFEKNSYDLEKLYSDLTQLYTEAFFYSEKEIKLIKVENNNQFIKEQMKDITDLCGKKIDKYSVLPGLFDNNKVISKILVFCEKFKNQVNNKKEMENYKCSIDSRLDKDNNQIKITINVSPKINESGVIYKLEFKDISSEKYNYEEKNNIFKVGKVFKNHIAICKVVKNNKILCKSEKKLEIEDPDTSSYAKNYRKNK